MKGPQMSSEWRTVQLFLDEELFQVCEVLISSSNPRKISCTCKPYQTSSRCKHVKFVRTSMDGNDGQYKIEVSATVTSEDSVVAIDTAEEWRDFVVKHGKVIVL